MLQPCVPIVFSRRSSDSLLKHGENVLVQWRPDSSMLVIATSDSYLLFYRLSDNSPEGRGLYEQRDSPITSLKRDSAELFIKEVIPSLILNFVSILCNYYYQPLIINEKIDCKII